MNSESKKVSGKTTKKITDEERLEALLKLSQLKVESEKELTSYALEECVRLTNSDVGYLHFFDEDENTLSLHNWSKEVLKNSTAKRVEHYPLKKAEIWADCVRQKKPIIHNDYKNYSKKKE